MRQGKDLPFVLASGGEADLSYPSITILPSSSDDDDQSDRARKREDERLDWEDAV